MFFYIKKARRATYRSVRFASGWCWSQVESLGSRGLIEGRLHDGGRVLGRAGGVGGLGFLLRGGNRGELRLRRRLLLSLRLELRDDYRKFILGDQICFDRVPRDCAFLSLEERALASEQKVDVSLDALIECVEAIGSGLLVQNHSDDVALSADRSSGKIRYEGELLRPVDQEPGEVLVDEIYNGFAIDADHEHCQCHPFHALDKCSHTHVRWMDRSIREFEAELPKRDLRGVEGLPVAVVLLGHDDLQYLITPTRHDRMRIPASQVGH